MCIRDSRWTVDEIEDFVFVTEIYKALYQANPTFQMSDILQFLKENPETVEINKKFHRNEGMERSLLSDCIFLRKEEKDGCNTK